jgi:hypothetical protein
VTEDELRELAGYPGPPEVTFAGQQWKVRSDPLAALLRYVLADIKAKPEEDAEGPALAAMHRLLEDCLVDFPAFSAAAFTAKVTFDDIQAVAKAVIEYTCARNFWPAMRLLGYLAGSLEEIDGNLLRTSARGLTSLTAREACNLALAVCLEGRDEESRQEFFIDLSYEGSPEAEALAALREYKAAQAAAAEASDGE